MRGRREGTFVYYTAGDEHVRELLAEALFHAEHTDRHLPEESEHHHRPGQCNARARLASVTPDHAAGEAARHIASG